MSNGPERNAIELFGVTKIYRSYPSPRHRLLELLASGKKRYSREVRALDDVTFTLAKGERIGIVGENGSGKSTLLKVLSGVLTPTSGTVSVTGRISALLELGAGFNPELTGRQNVVQFCMLHGMHEDEILAAMPEIVHFSELRDAVDHPVKTYSSGMAVRLGFACAVYVRPDILIVDEALAVGDAYFQNKCLHKIRSMLDEGITFIYVTHAADAIRSLCNRGLWMENGRIRLQGESQEVGAAYQTEIFRRMVRAELAPTIESPPAAPDTTHSIIPIDAASAAAFSERVAPLRTGSGEIQIDNIAVVDAEDNETDRIPFEATIRIRVFFHVLSTPAEKTALGLGINDKSGNEILHFNSLVHGIDVAEAAPHNQHMVEFELSCPLTPGEYNISAGMAFMEPHPQNAGQLLVTHVIDYCPGGARFSVLFPSAPDNRDLWGLFYIPCTVNIYTVG